MGNTGERSIAPLVEESREELARLCRRYQVRRLDLFGSAASGPFGEGSDLDFVVEFADLGPGEYARSYFGLLSELRALYGRPVDLVMRSAIDNPYFLESVESTRVPLYDTA